MGRLSPLECLLFFSITGVTIGCHIPSAFEDSFWEYELQQEADAPGRRVAREVTLEERLLCGAEDLEDQPSNRVNTTERLANLKTLMVKFGFDAYIIPTDDEHQSEYVAPADERRPYITGFSGTAGTAVVTTGQQALWTDGRYFLQADQQLDCQWLLMKQRNAGVPKMVEWLRQKLTPNSKVGADPRLIGAKIWTTYAEELAKSDIELVAEERNLVDLVWPAEERPPHSRDPVFVHELQFTGKKWEDKVAEVRAEMVKEDADLLVVTSLDEVAWLLNLRGNDIPYNPVFRSYVILGRDSVDLYIHKEKITPAVDHHLRVNQCNGQECVTINEYTAVLDRLRALKVRNHVKKVMLATKYSYSGGASYAIYSAVPEEMRMPVTSPLLEMKARKNPTEVEGMKNAHIKDAVAVCDFLAFMEGEILDGKYWDEIMAAAKLAEYRAEQEHYMGISFGTISAFGSNGAVIHYQPVQETNKEITNSSLYLLDSGGQYKDGTTDVTRTMHYGQPTPFQVEAYTRVLMGSIDLASLVFPEGTGDTDIDIMARRYLYEVGLDYRHGTGHGIGMFLNVHEAPIQVRIYGREEHEFEEGHFFSDAYEKTYQINFFGSHEPGFYQDNDFGIRLETIVTVVHKETPYHFDKKSLGFEAVTLVPFEAKLINVTMLNRKQCHWLNSYHARVRDVIGGELMTQNRFAAYEWLVKKTEALQCAGSYYAQVPGSGAEPQQERVTREVTLDQRTACKEGDLQPKVRVNTSSRVTALRQEMAKHHLNAYIVPMGGEHTSFTVEAEGRLPYMTGFSGSYGTAVVTADKQALWTDGRYFLQADSEIDCDWLLMKKNLQGVPTLTEWLSRELVAGAKVGADPRLVPSDTWLSYAKELNKSSIEMVAEEANLVDLVWPAEDRPPFPEHPIYIYDLQFAGKKWEDKVAEVRAEMENQGADILVVTALDEVAWLLNLRGNDVSKTPVFRAYVMIGRNNVELFVHASKITPAVDNHLNVNQCGERECVTITEYTAILSRLRALKFNNGITKVMLGSKYSYSGGASYAVYSAVPEEKRFVTVSPVLKMKARKNPTEVEGMKDAHVKDAVAVCDYLAFMENEIALGNAWNEMTGAAKLQELRSQQEHFTGPSFPTISAFGPNGAVIHYRPRPETNLQITSESLYLLDSGGQYKDGTTDVTRTVHYGQPTPFQVEAYTRVLMGSIDLASLVFPEGTGDTDIDIMARRPLYEVGLDYRHGTGHGIGHFLGVHEAPTQVRIYGEKEHKLEVGQFFSDEPGYYQDGEWGIRLENILTVVTTDTKYKFDKQSLTFEPVTLVPFEAKLVNLTLLTEKQCAWLNNYHNRVRSIIGAELLSQNRSQTHTWLLIKTEPLTCPRYRRESTSVVKTTTSTSTTSSTSTTTTIATSSSNSKQQTSSGTTEYATSAIIARTEEVGASPPNGCARLRPVWAATLTILMAVKTFLLLW